MESHKRTAKPTLEPENQSDGRKILVLPRYLDRKRSPTSIAEGGLSKADIIRGVTRNMMVDALAVLDKMREDCQQSPDLRENYHRLHRYLDYLKQFCEGRA